MIPVSFFLQRVAADVTSSPSAAPTTDASVVGNVVKQDREKRFLGVEARSSWLDGGPSLGFSAGNNLPLERNLMLKLLNENKLRQNLGQVSSIHDGTSTLLYDKRNLASLAATNNMPKNVKKSESSAVPPTAFPATQPKEDKQGDKRSIASLARDGKLPRTKKDTNLDDHWNEKNLSVAAHDTAPSVDKENFAPSAPASRQNVTLPQSVDMDKRHLSSIARANNFPKQNHQQKRYFGSLLKSNPPSFIENNINKRYVASLLDSFREEPGVDKRFYASLLKSNTPPHTAHLNVMQGQDKRHFASLLKSNSVPFLMQKRYFASLLKSPWYSSPDLHDDQEKRSYSSLFQDLPANTADDVFFDLNDLDDTDDTDLDKRHYSSLLKSREPGNGFGVNKRYVASLLSKRADDPSQMLDEEKRHLSSLFKPRRSDDSIDSFDEVKRHLASLYKPKRSDDSVDSFEEEKRHLASLYKPRRSDDSIDEEKRHLASLYKPRRSDDSIDEEKRHLASLYKPRRSDDSIDEEKRHLASLYKPRRSDDSIDEEKRHLASLYKTKKK
ncbi:uncharacterized protein LOC121859322 [Homarus americanus]|uniref:uncharacterized protein LOC121859322 n=1 Tax=Homarus americanus TaxID=6706 RepID=UPI001C439247|nr:uncharacterized protein LOC121859322 [Homarus americanus]